MATRTIHPSVRKFINLMLVDLQFARSETAAKERDMVVQYHAREDRNQDVGDFVCEKVMKHVMRQPL